MSLPTSFDIEEMIPKLENTLPVPSKLHNQYKFSKSKLIHWNIVFNISVIFVKISSPFKFPYYIFYYLPVLPSIPKSDVKWYQRYEVQEEKRRLVRGSKKKKEEWSINKCFTRMYINNTCSMNIVLWLNDPFLYV